MVPLRAQRPRCTPTHDLLTVRAPILGCSRVVFVGVSIASKYGLPVLVDFAFGEQLRQRFDKWYLTYDEASHTSPVWTQSAQGLREASVLALSPPSAVQARQTYHQGNMLRFDCAADTAWYDGDQDSVCCR